MESGAEEVRSGGDEGSDELGAGEKQLSAEPGLLSPSSKKRWIDKEFPETLAVKDLEISTLTSRGCMAKNHFSDARHVRGTIGLSIRWFTVSLEMSECVAGRGGCRLLLFLQ